MPRFPARLSGWAHSRIVGARPDPAPPPVLGSRRAHCGYGRAPHFLHVHDSVRDVLPTFSGQCPMLSYMHDLRERVPRISCCIHSPRSGRFLKGAGFLFIRFPSWKLIERFSCCTAASTISSEWSSPPGAELRIFPSISLRTCFRTPADVCFPGVPRASPSPQSAFCTLCILLSLTALAAPASADP